MPAPRLYISTITADLTTEYRALPKPHPGAVAYVPEGAGVRVKPLDWIWVHTNGGEVLDAVGFNVVYRIIPRAGTFSLCGSEVDGNYPTLDAAKAAAQADYEARIMAALEPMETSDE